jgi:Fic family protein
MNIAIQTPKALQVRLLKERRPYLTAHDIADLTGIPLAEVKGALKRQTNDKPKSRVW